MKNITYRMLAIIALLITLTATSRASDQVTILGPLQSIGLDITADVKSAYAIDGDVSYDIEDLYGNWIAHIQVNIENYNGFVYLHVYVETASGLSGSGTGWGGGQGSANCFISIGGFDALGVRITSSSGYNVNYGLSSGGIDQFYHCDGSYLGDPTWSSRVITNIVY